MQFSLCWILSQHLQSRRTREKPWRGAQEEKQHIWVWLKPSKHSPPTRYSFFECDSDYGRQGAHGKTHFIFSAAFVALPFGGPWLSWSPHKMICELCGCCKSACSTETKQCLMSQRGKPIFLWKGGMEIKLWFITCVQPSWWGGEHYFRILVIHVRTINTIQTLVKKIYCLKGWDPYKFNHG